MSKHKELIIESSLDELYRLDQFIEEISDEYLLYGNYFGNILMAVTEAVKNAINHGNQSDKKKRVRVRQELTREGLWVRVEDEGTGFDFSKYTDPVDPLQNLKSGKNGLFIIRKLTDEVIFKDKGRIIDMLFRINGIDESIFSRRVAFMQDFFKVYQHLNTSET